MRPNRIFAHPPRRSPWAWTMTTPAGVVIDPAMPVVDGGGEEKPKPEKPPKPRRRATPKTREGKQ